MNSDNVSRFFSAQRRTLNRHEGTNRVKALAPMSLGDFGSCHRLRGRREASMFNDRSLYLGSLNDSKDRGKKKDHEARDTELLQHRGMTFVGKM
jgi:hypothetical protein